LKVISDIFKKKWWAKNSNSEKEKERKERKERKDTCRWIVG